MTHAVMEVSSHGLDLGRLDGCQFDLGVFTNLTQDHLDYHGNLEQYYLAKRILFERLLPASAKANPAAIINIDDPYGKRLFSEIRDIPVVRFGTDGGMRRPPVGRQIHDERRSRHDSGFTGSGANPFSADGVF